MRRKTKTMPADKYPKSKNSSPGLFPKILILTGVAFIAVMLILAKNQSSSSAPPIEVAAEAQYDQYIKQGKPIFAFFHSTNCDSCIEMMEIVAQVHPEFKEQVALVDVDVYNEQNNNLLRRFSIRSIPTQVFIDRNGKKNVIIGVIPAVQLRKYLQSLKETP